MSEHKRDKLAKYTREMTAIDYVHDSDIDPEKNEIYLFGREELYAEDPESEPGVDYRMANRFIKNIRLLQSLNNEPILIHMKTNGGFWEEGMAIYQAIKACPNYVAILNYTWARSMSSIILQAADYRAMMPYSTFMYHDGTVGFGGTVRQFWTEAAQMKASQEIMMDIYLDKAEDGPAWEGRSRSAIKKMMRSRMDRKEEVYLTAEETVEQGFADLVFGDDGYDWNKLRG